MQKTVKILNLVAEKFGVFKALELDFDKFKSGVIAIKGNAGAGKSTVQKSVRLASQGREILDDPDQYGDEWRVEEQLSDGDRKIYIEAVKKKGTTPTYKLFEKDGDGKNVMNPIIDGKKATPASYMQAISTELTFGINEFLSKDATTHRKFMFKLFRPELEKLGVIFDKSDPKYKISILGELDQLTMERDQLRARCTHEAAFIADFEREGIDAKSIDAMTLKPLTALKEKRNQILISKGKAEGDARAEFERRKSEIIAHGQGVVEKIREVKQQLTDDYNEKNKVYNETLQTISFYRGGIMNLQECFDGLKGLWDVDYSKTIEGYNQRLQELENTNVAPVMPVCPDIQDGKLVDKDLPYEKDFEQHFKAYRATMHQYQELQENTSSTPVDYDAQIADVDREIAIAEESNRIIDRYNLNREWVDACGAVEVKRKELAKLYAQINTGVQGLRMKPFFDEDSAKMDIKTVYNGEYDPSFFGNNSKEDRLLVSYSSTQMPIIGILLQVARLKLKEKVLPYIFLDDVPMDTRSLALISKIAEENNLTVITSITGDFDKDKLTENEMLVEGGEVFFS